jgi:outer membrane protein assembly complex protein YaeT
MKKSPLVVCISSVLLSLGWSGCAGPEVKEKKIEQLPGRYIARDINFNFVDAKRTYKDKTLLKMLGLKRGDYIDEVLARFGREHLEEFYLKKGFAFVEVKLDARRISDDEMAYTYTIKEGPRVEVESVRFSGNKTIKTDTLKKAVKTNKRKWLVGPRYYTEEKVAEDVKRVEDLYWERGLLDHSITTRTEFTADKRKTRVTFAITEGPSYTVERIVLRGAEKIYGIDIDGRLDETTLREMLKLTERQTYIERKAQSDAKRLRKLYREYGFVDAEVKVSSPEFVPDANAVNIEFEISEGEQFRIGRIDITGNKETQDKVIRRVMDGYDFQPGKLYNADIAPKEGGGQLEQEIRRKVLVEQVTVTPLASDQPGQKNVEVNVKEGKTGQIMVGAGITSDRGVIGSMVWEQRNFDIKDRPKSLGELIRGEAFKGAGQSLRIALMPGTELSEYSVSFTEPYLNDQPISLDVIGLDNEWERESYEEGRTKGYVGLGELYEWRSRKRWRKNISLRFENVDVEGIDIDAPKEIKDVKGDNALAGVKLGVIKDLADDRFNPSTGYILDTGYEQVSGDHTFGIISGTYRQYKTVRVDLAERKTILTTRLHAATILGDAPPFEKFYAGGMRSIRGFEYRGVSPRGTPEVGGVPLVGQKKKDPIGSDWIFLANAEVLVPLVGESLSAMFFVDSGTVDTGGYRAAAGTGIQILIPQWFGPVPMRFGVAAPFMKEDEDDTEAFFFYVGRLF